MSDKTEGRFFCTCDRRTVPRVLYGVLCLANEPALVSCTPDKLGMGERRCDYHGVFCFDEWREADGVAMEQTGAG